MVVNSRFDFYCDDQGIVLDSNAPFYNSTIGNNLGFYFPLFRDPMELLNLDQHTVSPYEFQIDERRYLADLYVESFYKNGAQQYRVSFFDKTEYYKKIQQERTTKNSYRIFCDQLKELNKRLHTKNEQLEHVIGALSKTNLDVLISELAPLSAALPYQEIVNRTQGVKFKNIVKELKEIKSTLKMISRIQEISPTKSLQDTSYYSMEDVLTQTRQNLGSDCRLDVRTTNTKNRLFFLNKDHFAKTIEKLISYLVRNSGAGNVDVKLVVSYLEDDLLKIQLVSQGQIDRPILQGIDGILLGIDQTASNNLNPDHIDNLDIARKLIELYDGEFSIRSKSEDGSLKIDIEFDSLLSKEDQSEEE